MFEPAARLESSMHPIKIFNATTISDRDVSTLIWMSSVLDFIGSAAPEYHGILLLDVQARICLILFRIPLPFHINSQSSLRQPCRDDFYYLNLSYVGPPMLN